MTDQPPSLDTSTTDQPLRHDRAWRWSVRVIAGTALAVVGWTCLASWDAIVAGHPLYGALLAVTLIGAIVAGWRTLSPRRPARGWRRVARAVLLVIALGWVALLAWLRPLGAVEPALGAMQSDAAVQVDETATRIVLSPTSSPSGRGVFFQPGARVDARAYASVLRPLAEAGHPVVIVKQPLGVAFLATGAFGTARAGHPAVTEWVLGGHSLGGTVAALQADAADSDPTGPAVGLLLYASYPASDVSDTLSAAVLSIYATEDGLATRDDIAASRDNLPAGAAFLAIEGAVHAFFGDYGPQRGDGTPTISHGQARAEISRASVDFVTG